MSKNFFKELIISLLLCLAIILLLGVLLYEYVPMNKTVPNAVTYTTPEEARKELNNAFTELTGEGQQLHYKKDITLTYSKEKDGDNTVVTSNNICDRNKGIDASQRQ